MSYYIRIAELPQGVRNNQIWKIEGNSAFRLGVMNPERAPGSYFRAESGETIWDAIRRQTPWWEPDGVCPFHKTVLSPGQFYPRMARPIDQHPEKSPGWNPGAKTDADFIASSRGQLTTLMRQLDRICQTIHPAPSTIHTFGHDIRNLLILACTEVESHCRGVLSANGVAGDRFSMNDYVKLRAAMRLDEYAVAFPSYPWLEPVRSFLGWGSTGKSTQDLPWYDAYNAVKHDRENKFEKANLESAFAAVAACAIMIAAEFGLPGGLGQRSDFGAFFEFTKRPSWPLPEVYIYPYGGPDWTAVNYAF